MPTERQRRLKVPPKPDPAQRRTNPRSLANLKPWKKGQSGNPKGPPSKIQSLLLMVQEIADWPAPIVPAGVPPDPKKWSFARLLAWRVWTKAVAGDMRAAEMIFDRFHGRVPLALQLPPMAPDANGDGPGLRIQVVDARARPPDPENNNL